VDPEGSEHEAFVPDTDPDTNTSVSLNASLLGGTVADEGIFPNLMAYAVTNDDGVLMQNAVPFRVDESGDVWVPDEGAAALYFLHESDEPETGSGMTLAEFTTTNTESLNSIAFEAAQSRPDDSELIAASNDAKAAMASEIDGHALPTIGAATESEEKTMLQFNVPGYPALIDLDPMANPYIAQIQPWVRNAWFYILTFIYFWYMWKQFYQVMRDSGMARQAKGNTIAAGTGGQITSLIAAGIIAAIILAVPAIYFSATSGVSGTPLGTAPTESSNVIIRTAMYLFGLVFPYEYFFGLLSYAMLLLKTKVVIVSTVQAAVRFINP